MKEGKNNNLFPRPPIVVVMGHVDHGKTKLLDFIRRSNVVAKEPGEITQSTGAYEIEHNGKRITFIDTPGHEAFSKMRARGAKVADFGILVVAADEGVKPQTKEAIETLKESETPFIVAINKIDKPNADIEKTKQDLTGVNVLLEGFGGNISWQAISAKTGEGIKELLDLILLTAELEELKYNPDVNASGVIIEAELDSQRGIAVSLIVKNGILKVGDEIITPTTSGKIKILENFLGKRVEEVSPSGPALILGFNDLPQVGEEFVSALQMDANIAQILQIPQKNIREISAQISENSRAINLILKADVAGSLEAFSEVIKTIPDIKIIEESIGDITDGDVRTASLSDALIIGFRVKINRGVENLAKSQNIKIITSDVIYELFKNLEEKIKVCQEPKINGQLEILAIFGKKSGKEQIIGCRVVKGLFKRNLKTEIQRQEQIIGKAKIINLQKQKEDTNQITEGEECGILLESDTAINIGDQLIY